MLVRTLVIVVVMSLATRAQAQSTGTSEVAIPAPPEAPRAETPAQPVCPAFAEWRAGHCMRRGEHYELGPYAEGIGGGAAIFAAFYVLQLVSTAVSAAQGEHDVGPMYSAERLAAYREWGYVPLLGPWAKLVLAPPNVDGGGVTLFAFEGIFELAGVVALLVSLVAHPAEDWTEVPPETWSIVPWGNGIAARYVF